MNRLAVVFVSLLISFLTARAGVLAPGLVDRFSQTSSNAAQPVLIVLSERPDMSAYAESLRDQGMALSDVHSRVYDMLQAASASQNAVIKSLDILKSAGMASNVQTYWIVNVIAANLTKPGAELIANMAEVEAVGLDDQVYLRELWDVAAVTVPNTNSGLLQMGVPEVWQMGFRGENRTACIIADGVSPQPVLNSRWRGNSAAPAECWFDLNGSVSPIACGNVGTAMAGALCGAEFSIAPEANWIAARSVCGITRLSGLLAALQWAVDPDGLSATFNDVPDVICCGWGLSAACPDGVPEGVWDIITNIEAAGPLMVFPVQQVDRAGAATVRMPESLDRCFAVGNAALSGSQTIPNLSSGRGPSPCDPTVVKPDISAVGTKIPTFAANGSIEASGSALAAARVAGIALLLRQSNPNIAAEDIKRVLTTSATDVGGSGPDNTFGYGLVNISHALSVSLSSGQTGAVKGTILDGNEYVAGVKVVLAGPLGEISTTSRSGSFSFDHVVAGQRYALRAGRFGYRVYFHSDSLWVESGVPNTISILLERNFEDDAEYDQNWSLGVEGDDATGGAWVRAVPMGTRADGKLVSPDADASPLGSRCFVTGNAMNTSADAGDSDVDGGKTTLRSPVFSLLGISAPVVNFSYWFSNDRGSSPGSDFFRAQISNDGGRTWMNLINTASSTSGWMTVHVRINDFVPSTDRMMLQFVAEDEGPGSLVEAAVDDISITGAPSDLEAPRDLTLNVQSDHVQLIWHPSPGASSYRVYLSGTADRVVAPENLYTTTSDTMLLVPMRDIRFNEFFFQVTASK